MLEDTSMRQASWNARNNFVIDTRSTVDDGTLLYNPFTQTITRLHPETKFGEFLFFHSWTENGRYLFYQRVQGTSYLDQREWIIYDDDTGQHHVILAETHHEDELWSLFIEWSPDLRYAVLRFEKQDANNNTDIQRVLSGILNNYALSSF